MEEPASVPEADQARIGRLLLSHVEKLRRLRADNGAGIDLFDAGEERLIT